MAKAPPDPRTLLQTIESAIESSSKEPELTRLIKAVECLDRLRSLYRRNPDAIAPLKERINSAKARMVELLRPHIDQLTNETFGLKTEIDALERRFDNNKSALKEVFRAQSEPKLRITVPAFEGTLVAYERESFALPRAETKERAELEAKLRSRPEYWIEASNLHGGKIKALCDRIAAQDSKTSDAIMKYLSPNRDFTILLRSPQLGIAEETLER
jgi:hypothetical protein